MKTCPGGWETFFQPPASQQTIQILHSLQSLFVSNASFMQLSYLPIFTRIVCSLCFLLFLLCFEFQRHHLESYNIHTLRSTTLTADYSDYRFYRTIPRNLYRQSPFSQQLLYLYRRFLIAS